MPYFGIMLIMKNVIKISLVVLAVASTSVFAGTFQGMDRADPERAGIMTNQVVPVVDYDNDSCLPSAAVNRDGVQNGGRKPSGSMTGDCRDGDFLRKSNFYHRYMCKVKDGNEYCGHMFEVYFKKDQWRNSFWGQYSGHRHDVEAIVTWTKNGELTHASTSAHGDWTTVSESKIPKYYGHPMFVYHKDNVRTHAMRVAKTNEQAENPAGVWGWPPVVSWYTMKGDGISNQSMRNKFNSYDFGSASFKIKDSKFKSQMNSARPSGYPEFYNRDRDNSK